MEKIVLNDKQAEVLRRCAQGTFNAMVAPAEEQDIEIELIKMAGAFEQKYDLIDERMDFSEDCDILKWFYHRYTTQDNTNVS